jgi:hypothetical protein
VPDTATVLAIFPGLIEGTMQVVTDAAAGSRWATPFYTPGPLEITFFAAAPLRDAVQVGTPPKQPVK